MYWTVLAREGFLAAGLLGQIARSWCFEGRKGDGGGKDAKALEEGLGVVRRAEEEDEELAGRKLRRGLWLWVAELAPFIVGRLWILQRRREWFE